MTGGSSGTGNSGSFVIVAAIIALSGVALTALVQGLIGRRTIRVNTETAREIAQQAKADALAKRYHDAAAMLGDPTPPVRLAGAYAMARLADDWEAERQTCVDVLCAYLRMPWETPDLFGENDEDPPDPPETQVRHTIVRLIAKHLRTDAPVSWSDLTIDLTGAKLPSLEILDARIDQRLILVGCQLLQAGQITNTQLAGGADAARVHLPFGMNVHNCTLGGELSFAGAIFSILSESSFIITHIALNASINLSYAQISGKMSIVLKGSSEPQGPVLLGYLSDPGGREVLHIVPHTLGVGTPSCHYPLVTRSRHPREYKKKLKVGPPLEVELQN